MTALRSPEARESRADILAPAAIGLMVMLAARLFANMLFAPAPVGRPTVMGVRPLAADMLWMNALRAAGEPASYRAEPARARSVADRLRTSLRLAPDVRARHWQGALLLGVLEDTAGMRAFFATSREVAPNDPELALVAAVWGRWMEEGRADASVRELIRLWNANALEPAARRTAIAIARISGDSETARALIERYRRETGDEDWARAEERLVLGPW